MVQPRMRIAGEMDLASEFPVANQLGRSLIYSAELHHTSEVPRW